MLLTMRRRNTTVFYFIALEMQLWKPPEGAEGNSSGQIPACERLPRAGILQSSNTTVHCILFSRLFYLLTHPSNTASPGTDALISIFLEREKKHESHK